MSTAGDTDSVFSDAETGPMEEPRRRKRGREPSIPELISAYEKKQRQTKSPKGKSPKGKSPKRPDLLSTEMMTFIKEIIESSIEASVNQHLSSLNRMLKSKLDSQEKKIEVLEGDVFEKSAKIQTLESDLRENRQALQNLELQVDDMERHERGVNLVLTCQQFRRRHPEEDIRGEIVRILRSSFPDIPVSKADFSAAHRLPRDDTVICAFRDRELRNRFYRGRFQLRNSATSAEQQLYLSESLTKRNRELFSELVTMKKKKHIWSAFTSNGVPGYKLGRDSPPVHVTSAQQVRDLWRQLREQREATRLPAAVSSSNTAPPVPAVSHHAGSKSDDVKNTQARRRTHTSPPAAATSRSNRTWTPARNRDTGTSGPPYWNGGHRASAPTPAEPANGTVSSDSRGATPKSAVVTEAAASGGDESEIRGACAIAEGL